MERSYGSVQTNFTEKLYEDAGVPIGPCGLEQIKLFEIVLSDYQFVIVPAEHGHTIVHEGLPSEKQIMLLMDDGHFDIITKLPAFFNSSYLCLKCEKAYISEDYTHHCKKTKCNARYQIDCPDYEYFKHTDKPEVPCRNCDHKFYGVTCHVNHLIYKVNGQLVAQDENNVCKTYRLCSVCKRAFSVTSEKHATHCGM